MMVAGDSMFEGSNFAPVTKTIVEYLTDTAPGDFFARMKDDVQSLMWQMQAGASEKSKVFFFLTFRIEPNEHIFVSCKGSFQMLNSSK